jgi:WD40 repeat protein
VISTGVDPQDVATGFSGRYIYVVTDGPDQLEVFDTEVGPVIEIVSPISGGDGTKIALMGSGFDPGLSTVMIGGVPATPDTVSPDSSFMLVSQPVGADDSGVSVMSGTQASNAKPFNVVNRPDEGNLTIAAVQQTGTIETMNLVMMSPTEEYLVTTYQNGTVIVLGGDPSGANFLLPVQTILPTTTALPGVTTPDTHRMVMTPDGRKLYTEGAGSRLNVWDVAPSGTSNPVTFLGAVTDDGVPASIDVDNLVLSPDGKRLFALDVTASTVYEIDTASDGVNTAFSVGTAAPGAMAIGPDGSRLFLGNFTSILALFTQVRIVDVAPDSPTYGTEVGSVGSMIMNRTSQPSLTP